MSTESPRQIVLAIEAAIGGGSLSLLDGTVEIESRTGKAGVSRAEDLLVDIADLLKSHNIAPRDVYMIAASAGPGSFTGIRIGIATALGFARGSGAVFASTSLLAACAALNSDGGESTVILPVGRGSVAIQDFTTAGDEAAPPVIVAQADINDLLSEKDGRKILVHPSLAEFVASDFQIALIDANLAFTVGLRCFNHPQVTEPLFLSKN